MPNSIPESFITRKLQLYANNATQLLSNFQVHRHIKAIPVVTYISSGWRPRPPPHKVYMSRLKPENNEDIRNVKRPTTEKTGTNTCPVTILIRPGLHRPEALGRWDCMEAAMAPDELMLSLLTQLCRKYLPKIGKSFSLGAPHPFPAPME